MNHLLIGTDPEFFITDKEENCLPPVYFKKEHILRPLVNDWKHPLYFKRRDVKIIQDGVAFEVNTTPSKTPQEFKNKIDTAIDILGNFATRTNNRLLVKSTVGFDPNRFININDAEIRECCIFGCDPDKDAFDSNFEAYEMDVSTFPLRFGGGHLHISGSWLFKRFPKPMIKLLAFTCGNYYVANSKMPEEDKKRASYYGSAGKFRIQKYSSEVTGLEYRSLPNYWVVNLDMIESMFSWVTKALEYLKNPKLTKKLIKEYSDPTVKAMKEVDSNLSKQILASLP